MAPPKCDTLRLSLYILLRHGLLKETSPLPPLKKSDQPWLTNNFGCFLIILGCSVWIRFYREVLEKNHIKTENNKAGQTCTGKGGALLKSVLGFPLYLCKAAAAFPGKQEMTFANILTLPVQGPVSMSRATKLGNPVTDA